MLASLERVLPTQVKDSVASSGSSFTKICDIYVWLVIHLSRCRLVHDFCLHGADGKTKVVASSGKVIHALLHFRFSVADESAVIRKEEFSQCGYRHLSLCFESSEVEHSSIHLFCTSVGCHYNCLVKRRDAWQRIQC